MNVNNEPLQENDLGSCYMKREPCAERQAVAELRLALLVAKYDHSRDTAGRASQNRKNKEHGLRNAESALHCAYLINDHSGKAEQVHNEKIEKKH